MKFKIDPKLYETDRVYGTTTIGERGQLVIPVQARKDLGLKPGDHMLVLGKMNKALGLIKLDELEDIVKLIMAQISSLGDEETEKHLKSHVEKLFAQLPTKKKKK